MFAREFFQRHNLVFMKIFFQLLSSSIWSFLNCFAWTDGVAVVKKFSFLPSVACKKSLRSARGSSLATQHKR